METYWNFKRVLWLLVLSIGLWIGLQRFDIVLLLLQGTFKLMTPLLLGFCIAFIVNVLMVPVESLIAKSRVKAFKRPIALLVSLLLGIAVFVVLLLLIVPAFSDAIQDIISALPEFWSKVQQWLETTSQNLPFDIAEIPNLELDTKAIVNWAGSFLSIGGSTVVNATLGITSKVLGTTLNLLLGLVFAIYGLSQKEVLAVQCKRMLYATLSEKTVKLVIDTATLSHRIFSNFIRGQLTEAFVIGALCFIGMLLFNFPHALAVSVLVGVTALIPVFGAIIGIALGAFLIVMISPVKALWFVLFIVILQQLESNLIYPKVVGDSIGLPGIWVLVAVTIGAGTFGVLGMLIGVPLSSVIYACVGQWVDYRLKLKKIKTSKI